MAFHFALGTVLRVRDIVEAKEERVLQTILFEISKTRDALARVQKEIEAAVISRNAGALDRSLALELHASYGELNQLRARSEELAEQIRKFEILRDKQVIIFEQARRNREMLTDMRAKKLNAYESDIARGEQKIMDDNFIARRGRL